MTRVQLRTAKRSAFTLIELMIVILILVILVSLLAGAVMKVMARVPEVKTRTEIAEMDVALRAFMNDYQLSDPPPSALLLSETTPLSGASAQFLQKVFGKNLGNLPPGQYVDWNGDGVQNGPWLLQGEQCLVFYLGGIPSAAGPQGFSTNNMNPAAAGGKRKGPYFNFETPRLLPGPTWSPGFAMYIDAWQVKTGPKPYAYFSSQGVQNGYSNGDCLAISANAYQSVAGQYTFPNGYQIISAGKDGVFGGPLWNPTSGAVAPGADDQANFSSTLLGLGQN